ncbi:hypothetical protein [Myxococcus xanthus]|uniref:hypothetical protein n=1 Tax=Myxococcus xanthus TaxID=34 RepID=UPI001CED1434|nr:hypothetical protein [Myxococcus xanthus]
MRATWMGVALAAIFVGTGCGGMDSGLDAPAGTDEAHGAEVQALTTCEDCHATYTACIRQALGDPEETQVCIDQRHECALQYCP